MLEMFARSLVVSTFAAVIAACSDPRLLGDAQDEDQDEDQDQDENQNQDEDQHPHQHHDQACGWLEPRGSEEVVLCNELDQALLANVALPEGNPPSGGWPGVVILHGSGGLYFSEDEGDGDGGGDELGACSMELQDQFQFWRDLLVEQGYAVAMPDSFYSRGFCEWNEADDLTEDERLIFRLFDARAAQDWLCDHPEVDCDRLALLGFSNGASIALLASHDDLSVADDPRLHEHGPNRAIRGTVAYYPGCGLQGELANSTEASDRERFFSPLAPVLVQHAVNDSLLEDCEEVRDPQVEQVDADAGRSDDWFDLRVYEGADHGFDGASDGDSEDDLDARTAAQASTLDALADWLGA